MIPFKPKISEKKLNFVSERSKTHNQTKFIHIKTIRNLPIIFHTQILPKKGLKLLQKTRGTGCLTWSLFHSYRSSAREYCLWVSGPTFHSMLLDQPTAWTQWIQPELTQTRSPGRWRNRYTGISASIRSDRIQTGQKSKKIEKKGAPNNCFWIQIL